MKIYDVRGIGASLTGSFSGSFKGLFTGPLDGVAATSSYVEYTNVANKPTLVSGSSQITYSGISSKPAGIVSGSSQVLGFNVFATTGSNQFNGNQSITGSLTVSGQVIAQTLNVQQVTSSIVYSSGSNIFGNNSGNTHRFTGSVNITGSITVNGSGLVPYTGATQEVNLGVYSITANSLLTNQITVNPSGTTAAQVFLKHGSSFSLPNGFGSIGSSTGNEFRLYQVSSGGVWRAANISLNSITSSATRTYTLPDSDGTIALTSALSDYVTIATTQTITGAKTFNTTTSEFAGFNSTNASGGVLTFRRSGTNVGHIGNSAQLGGGVLDAIEVRSGTGSSVILKSDGGALTLATGGGVTLTGALSGTSGSFSGNVGVGANPNQSGIGSSNRVLTVKAASSGGEALLELIGLGNNATDNIAKISFMNQAATTALASIEAIRGSSDTVGELSFKTSNTTRLTIASTGAATFSSSVNVGNAGAGSTFNVKGGASNSQLEIGNLANGTNYILSYDRVASTYKNFLITTNASDNALFINTTGSIGIGTTSPEALLHLSQAATGGNGAFIFIDNPASSTLGNTAGIRFATNAGASFSGYGSSIEAVNTNNSDGAEALTFSTWNGASRGERMRITSEGYLGTTVTSTTVSADDLLGVLSFVSKDSSTYSSGGITNIRSYATTTYNTGNVSGDLRFYVSNGLQNTTGTYLFGTEAMRITSTGNVEIRSAGELRVYRSDNARYGTFYTDNNNVNIASSVDPIALTSPERIVFNTAGTERMRITSVGYLQLSNDGNYISSGSPYHQIKNTAATLTMYLLNHNAAGDGLLVNLNTNSTDYHFFRGYSNSVEANRIIIYSNGNIQNVNNSYGALSDIKLKENITDASPKLDDLMKVKVRNYNLIGEETKQIGVIAQELEEIFPAMVDESTDFEEVEVPQLDTEGNEILDKEGQVVTIKERVSKGTSTKSVKYSVFVPMLIKAIQEQQSQIEILKAEIQLLKQQ